MKNKKRSKINIFKKQIEVKKKNGIDDMMCKVRCTLKAQQSNTTRQEVLSRSIQSSSYLICRLLGNEFIDRGPSPPASP